MPVRPGLLHVLHAQARQSFVGTVDQSKGVENVRNNIRAIHGEGRSVTSALLPIMTVVFIGFLIIGMALPVLPLHVHQSLGMSTFVVGLVAGSQFVAALVTRVWSGRYADSRGAKHAVLAGLAAAVAGGLLYLFAPPRCAWLSVAILLLGRRSSAAPRVYYHRRCQLGAGARGPANAGKVIAWVGMAMFAALASGAPLGTALYSFGGFASIAVATALIPLFTMLVVAPLAASRRITAAIGIPQGGRHGLDARPGFGTQQYRFRHDDRFQLVAIHRAQLESCMALIQAFAISLVAARLFLGHLPDRLGGAKVALISVFIETVAWRSFGCTGPSFRRGWRSAHRPWLCAGLSRPRRRSRSSCAAAEPWPRDGGLYRLPRCGARVWQPRTGPDRGMGRIEFVFLAGALIVLCAAAIAARLLFVPAAAERCLLAP